MDEEWLDRTRWPGRKDGGGDRVMHELELGMEEW